MPVAYGYGRISEIESEITCPGCDHEFMPDGVYSESFSCPKCDAVIPSDLLDHSVWSQLATIETYWRKHLQQKPSELKLAFARESAAKDFRDRSVSGKIFKLLSPGDHLIVTQMDRGWINPKDFLLGVDPLLGVGVTVHCIAEKIDTSTPDGAVFGKNIKMLAAWERVAGSARAVEALTYLRRQGRPTNGKASVASLIVCEKCGHPYRRKGTVCQGCGAIRRGNAIVVRSAVDHGIMLRLIALRRDTDKTWPQIVRMFNNEKIVGKWGTVYKERHLLILYRLGLSLEEAGKLMTVDEINTAMPAQVIPPAA